MNLRAFAIASLLSISGLVAFAADPALVITAPTLVRETTATLNGKVTANTHEGTLSFIYGKNLVLDQTAPISPDMAAADSNRSVSANLTGLENNTTYNFKLKVIRGGDSVEFTSALGEFTTGNPIPVARNDSITRTTRGPVVIQVLDNDTDADGHPLVVDGDPLTIINVSKAKDGTVIISDDKKKLVYYPAQFAKGLDTFTYTISDGEDEDTATVTVLAPKLAFTGLQAFELKNAEGKTAGLVSLTGTGEGRFTGKITINGETYSLAGTFDENGKFTGTITSGDGSIYVSLNLNSAGSGFNLAGSIVSDGQTFAAEAPLVDLSMDRRRQLDGEYTIQLPGGGTASTDEGTSDTEASDLPEGTGFARIKVTEWGEVSVVGRLADDTKFSAGGVVMGSGDSAQIAFYADPDDQRLSGTLTFDGDDEPTLAGPLNWFRPPDEDEKFFPNGFDTIITATGGRYVRPEEGDRALETNENKAEELTITFSGGNLARTITHPLVISENDEVLVLDETGDELKMKISRKKGTFKGKFLHNAEGEDRKFQGALFQSDQTGKGLFLGQTQTGTVSIGVKTTTAPETTRAPAR